MARVHKVTKENQNSLKNGTTNGEILRIVSVIYEFADNEFRISSYLPNQQQLVTNWNTKQNVDQLYGAEIQGGMNPGDDNGSVK